MPSHIDQVNFDPHTKTKYFSIPTQKASQFRSLNWSQVNFDPRCKIKLILMRRHQNQVNLDPYTKNKSISTHKLKSSETVPPT